MRRTSWLAILALCTASLGAAASGGCQVSPAVTVVHLGPGEKSEAVQGDLVKTRRGGQEAYVGLRGGYSVVRTLEDWRNAWPGGKEPPLPATLDTTHSMLVLAVAERKDSTQLRIEKVLETGDRLHVWVKETQAGSNCNTKIERAPFDAVVAPRIDKPVKFYVEDQRAESCGDPPAVAVKCRVNDTPTWTPKVSAQPGDKVECELSAETRGKFAIVDSSLSLGELPGGSSAKLAYTRGAGRGGFAVDVFGTYQIRGEATDEAGRKSEVFGSVEALPPKTRDVLVQLVWTNFDVSDDPDTFPRVKLRAVEETSDAKDVKQKPVQNECSLDNPRPDLCEVKTRSAYTHMKLKASDKKVPLDVFYVDERIDKGPLVCVQVYFDGARTGETCDRRHRDAEERWAVGSIDMQTGKVLDPVVATADAGADAAAPKKPVAKPAAPKK